MNTKRRWLHLYIANATCSSNINSRPSPSTQSQHHSLYPNLIAASRNWQSPPARSPPPPLQGEEHWFIEFRPRLRWKRYFLRPSTVGRIALFSDGSGTWHLGFRSERRSQIRPNAMSHETGLRWQMCIPVASLRAPRTHNILTQILTITSIKYNNPRAIEHTNWKSWHRFAKLNQAG